MSTIPKEGDKRVFIAQGLSSGEQQAKFIELHDPRSGSLSQYLLTTESVQEINWFKQQYSSFFVGNGVLQDGGLYMATPVDALFFLIPMLEKAGDKFCDLEHILTCGDSQHAALLTPLVTKQLQNICDVKEAGGQSYYRLSHEKASFVLQWLTAKVEQAKTALKTSDTSSTFSGMDEIALSAYAAGLISEYLSNNWEERLKSELKLPDESAMPVVHHAEPLHRAPNEVKRAKFDPKEAAKAKAAAQRKEAKEAKLAKEAAGMKKLSAFFKK